jgi:predicted lysophospholipase L1 biosynthesis ABC-type transport system permease subunit
MPTGIDPDNVVQIAVDERLRDATVRALNEHPAVRELAGSSAAPLEGMFPAVAIRPVDQRGAPVAQVRYNFVSPDYFSVLGISIVLGRAFTADEAQGHAQAAVISRSLANAFWPGRDPVGQVVRLARDAPAGSPLQAVRTARVVGVARNAVSGWIGTGLDRPVIYFPARLETRGMLLLARVSGNEARARARLDTDVPSALAAAPIDQIVTLNDLLAVQVYPFRAFSWVAGALGAVALVLTITGIYGVLAHLVRQRTREIGIRMALGASSHTVVRMVVRQCFILGVVGVAAGTFLALLVSKLFSTALVVVDTFDAIGYAAGVAAVLAATVAASYAPAARAARMISRSRSA